MGIWMRVNGNLELMSRMFGRAGVFEGDGAVGALEMDLKNAIARCIACSQTDACRAWLDGDDASDHPPAFCANADLIERLHPAN